ncbi:hypothetical protein [Christiangramia sabulilitoris]|uniref:Uncharacterized protein n=1 Tax=Christiangramia sabulilitoris TaxID=2583991 RepID=A0A550I7J7_9FLAO|nr:hypothetical protein [Christiangramia sabulilitoris]TRO66946.1 hypothetical protein FGM01_03385 [Christiangramia sabulilitoris]
MKPLEMRNRYSFLIIILVFLYSAVNLYGQGSSRTKKPNLITHYNIKIVSDLSNRLDDELYPRQLEDREIISEILHIFPDVFRNYNRLAFQKDKLSYGLLNPLEFRDYNSYKDDLSLDLGAFGQDQFKRVDYVRNRSENAINTDIAKFNSAVHEIYQHALERGSFYTADTWGFFKQVVDENYFNLTNPINTVMAKDISRNIIVLLTDGFIEVANRNSINSCIDRSCELLNSHQIEKFRKYYNNLETKMSLKEAFKASGYKIKPVNNPNLKGVEVLMLELNGRSKTKSGRITKTPTDFEILKLYWKDFLTREGVKKIEIKNVQPSTDNINQIVKAFLEE